MWFKVGDSGVSPLIFEGLAYTLTLLGLWLDGLR